MNRYPQKASERSEVLSRSKKGGGRHRVLKMRHQGNTIVVKCYGLKRSIPATAAKRILTPFGVGKSSSGITCRRKTEAEVLMLWRNEGFAVPRIYPDIVVPGITEPHLAMEWVPGMTLAKSLRSQEIPLARKLFLIDRFARETRRRHDRAIDLQDVRLLFEHPTLKHIIVYENRMVHCDFEVVYTPKRDLERMVCRELGAFLYAVSKTGSQHRSLFLHAMIEAYENQSRINRVMELLCRFGTVPVHQWMEIHSKIFMLFKKYREISATARSLNWATPLERDHLCLYSIKTRTRPMGQS